MSSVSSTGNKLKATTSNRILVGSCNSQYYQPVLWESMIQRNSTAFIWAGDAIYGDTFTVSNLTQLQRLVGKRRVQEATPNDINNAYKIVLNDSGYNKLLKRQQQKQQQQKKHSNDVDDTNDTDIDIKYIYQQNFTVLGVWDDHDYGVDNGDKNYQYKLQSAKMYMNFIKRSNSIETNLTIMEQRAASGLGIYGVKVFDFTRIDTSTKNYLLSDIEAGLEPSTINNNVHVPLSNRSVAIFLLDVRTNRDPWPNNDGKIMGWSFEPDYNGDFLGTEQWEWLESTLQRSTASINIIVQGLQVHPDRYFDGKTVEAWGRYPKAQHRLYQLILKSNVSVPILVGGDVHKAELLRKDCRKVQNFDNADSTRMILEVTTSGMTHSWGTNICSRPNDKLLCRTRFFKFVLANMMHYAQNNHLWTEVVHLKYHHDKKNSKASSSVLPVGTTTGNGQVQEGSKTGYQYTLDRNFGEFEFDWDAQQVIIRILGENVNGKPLISTKWDFKLLTGNIPPEDSVLQPGDFKKRYQILSAHDVAHDDDWVCVNYLGELSIPAKVFSVVSPGTIALFVVLSPLVIALYIMFTFLRRLHQRNFRSKKQKQY